MFGLFLPPADASEAARTLSQHSVRARAEQAANHRRRVREMANQLRADLRAKGVSNLPDIDWSTFS